MCKSFFFTIICLSILPLNSCQSQPSNETEEIYTYKNGDVNGTGKWYMGREIAYVMGYQGINWLERSTREQEENTSTLLRNMKIEKDDVIADIGAGSGYHVFKMAPKAKNGKVYAVDIQDEMLAAIEKKKNRKKVSNIELIKGSETSVNLQENSIDKFLMVDVYHEFAFPKEIIASVISAMKDDAKLYLIEYRGEDPTVPIKKVHKMTEQQAILEMEAAGLKLQKNIANLPWQHCMVFVKAKERS